MCLEVAMRRRNVFCVAGLVVLAAVLQDAGWIANAQPAKSQSELRKALIGTWRLVSIEGGTTQANRGARPTGLIYYDANGYMAAQIMPDRPRPKWTGAPTPEQALEAFRGYNGLLRYLHARREGRDRHASPARHAGRRRGGFCPSLRVRAG
jgi:hypothetical protein